jgi:hypothetical protein
VTTDLVIDDWNTRFEEAMRQAKEEILLVAPFVRSNQLGSLLEHTAAPIRVLTRFNLRDFYQGVSSLDTLARLLERGAEIKGIQGLHTKLYVFDRQEVIITSANLTDAAFKRNHELGIATEDPRLVGDACRYFEDLWQRAGAPLLSMSQIDAWRGEIDRVLAEAGPPQRAHPQLVDHGASLGRRLGGSPAVAGGMEVRDVFASPPQWFVKFSATDADRALRSMSVRDAVERFRLHSGCYYGRPPRQVKDGAVMFLSRLVAEPDDIMIVGRALGQAHVDGRDRMSEQELQMWPRKARWPFLIRIHDVELMDGTLEQGVSLYELMDELGAESFRSTSENAARGNGNMDPRRSCRRQPHVELTPQAAAWLTERLIERMRMHGSLTEADLARY